jgi:predicted ArsR family transcriptional regulator
MPFGDITSNTVETKRVGPSGETIDTPRHRALGSDSRVTILRLIRDAAGGLTAAEVAARTGQHLSTTRAHLERLVEAGLLVRGRASGGMPGRPAWRYRATTADPVPAPYRSLAAALLEHLAPEGGDVRGAAGRIGRDWGRQLAAAVPAVDEPVTAVVTVLRGLGFEPAVQADARQVHLYTCPFLDLVGQNPDAMCGLHAGVVQGVLDQQRVPAEGTVLEPFGAPAACVVHLPPPASAAGVGSPSGAMR